MAENVTNWLVSDYIYNADGSYAGVMQQKRRVESLAEGRVRVTMHGTPGLDLGAHPMSELAGESVYEISRDGRRQQYHGPDMIGTGLAWGDSVVTAGGVWSRFGHNYSAIHLLVSAERQISITRYMNARELVASVISLAVPESAKNPDYPMLTASFYPQETSRLWEGSVEGFNPAGESILQGEESRRYHFSERRGWAIHESSRMWKLDEMDYRTGMQEEPGDYGIGKRSGWLFDLEHFAPPVAYSRMEILDNEAESLHIITRTYEYDALTYFSVTHLKPRA